MLMYIENAPKYIRDKIEEVAYKKHNHIILQGMKNNFVYFIKEGTVQIANYDQEGKQNNIFTQEKESIFGEVELYREVVPTFNVIAITDVTVYRLSQKNFTEWIENDPNFLKAIYTQLVDKLLYSTTRQIDFINSPLEKRIKMVIRHYHEVGTLETLTKSKLCEEVQAPIRSVNRVLAHITNYVTYRGKKFKKM